MSWRAKDIDVARRLGAVAPCGYAIAPPHQGSRVQSPLLSPGWPLRRQGSQGPIPGVAMAPTNRSRPAPRRRACSSGIDKVASRASLRRSTSLFPASSLDRDRRSPARQEPRIASKSSSFSHGSPVQNEPFRANFAAPQAATRDPRDPLRGSRSPCPRLRPFSKRSSSPRRSPRCRPSTSWLELSHQI